MNEIMMLLVGGILTACGKPELPTTPALIVPTKSSQATPTPSPGPVTASDSTIASTPTPTPTPTPSVTPEPLSCEKVDALTVTCNGNTVDLYDSMLPVFQSAFQHAIDVSQCDKFSVVQVLSVTNGGGTSCITAKAVCGLASDQEQVCGTEAIDGVLQ